MAPQQHIEPAVRPLDDGTFEALVKVTDPATQQGWDHPIPNGRVTDSKEAWRIANEYAELVWQRGLTLAHPGNPPKATGE